MDKIYRYSISLPNYSSSIKLDINEYNFQHPPEFYITLFSALTRPKCVTHYSNMFCEETTRLIKNIANITNITHQNILLTPGSDTALEYMVTCLFNDDNINLYYMTPNYSYIADYLKKNKKNSIIPIEFDILKDKYTLSSYLDKYVTINHNHHTRHNDDNDDNNNRHVVYISNPNNPTGICIDKGDFHSCLLNYPNFNFIVDEAYIDFTENNESMCESILSFSNLYIIRTFSKAYGIAGLRLGYILSAKQNITYIHNTAFNEASLTEISKCAGNYILEHVSYYKEVIHQTITNKNQFLTFLEKNDIFYIPSHANFVSVYIGKKSSEFTSNLQQKGIIVRNKTKDTNMYGFVRITIGTLEQMEMVSSYIIECYNDLIESKTLFLSMNNSIAQAQSQEQAQFIIYSDFDNTITNYDILDKIIEEKYSYGKYKEIEELLLKNEMKYENYLLDLFQGIEYDLHSISKDAIDPTFHSFYTWTKTQNIDFYIISAGFKSIIAHLLPYIDRTSIFANDIHIHNQNNATKWIVKLFDEENHSSINKNNIIASLHRPEYKTIFIGDGLSDFNVIGHVDYLFCKRDSLLHAKCVNENHHHIAYNDFGDVLNKIKALYIS